MTGDIFYLFCFVMLGFMAYNCYRHYRTAKNEEKPKMIRVFLVVFLLSVFLFAGIRSFNIPEKLGLTHEQVTESEALNAFEQYIKNH